MGRGRGLVPRVRNAKMGTDEGRGARARGSCGEGPRQNVGMGTGPRGRMRTRCSCGEGCVEDTRRCSCTDHWQVRHDHGRVFGRSYTRRQSTRSHMETRCGWFPPHTKASHSPCAPDASCMQHEASSMSLRATDMQQKCKCLNARDDSMSAPMHRAVSRLSANATPKPSQGRTNKRTMADSGMSVNLKQR